MKKTTTSISKQRAKELQTMARVQDQNIDFSEIPELTEEQIRRGRRGLFYRPVKKSVTMRLDSDVIGWLKREGRGYQTKANRLLRSAMLADLANERVMLRKGTLPPESGFSNVNASSEPVVDVWTRSHPAGRADAVGAEARTWDSGSQQTPGVSRRTPGTNTPGIAAAA